MLAERCIHCVFSTLGHDLIARAGLRTAVGRMCLTSAECGPVGAEAFRACGMIFYSPVPPSASSALKCNLFSKAAISASEIVKRAGSIGAASGGFWRRRRSQARSSSLSSRSAAFRNASKNRWRCAALSRPQGLHRRLEKITAPHPAMLNSAMENGKTEIPNMPKGCRRAVPPFNSRCQKDPSLNGGVTEPVWPPCPSNCTPPHLTSA